MMSTMSPRGETTSVLLCAFNAMTFVREITRAG